MPKIVDADSASPKSAATIYARGIAIPLFITSIPCRNETPKRTELCCIKRLNPMKCWFRLLAQFAMLFIWYTDLNQSPQVRLINKSSRSMRNRVIREMERKRQSGFKLRSKRETVSRAFRLGRTQVRRAIMHTAAESHVEYIWNWIEWQAQLMKIPDGKKYFPE